MRPGNTSRPTRRKVSGPKIEASQTQALRNSGLRFFFGRRLSGLPNTPLKESDCHEAPKRLRENSFSSNPVEPIQPRRGCEVSPALQYVYQNSLSDNPCN